MSWARGDLRGKLALTTGMLAAAMAVGVAGLALLLAGVEGLLLAAGLARRQRPVLMAGFSALPFALLNAALYGSTPVAGLPLYSEGLEAGAAFAARAVLAVALGWWVLATTPPRAALHMLSRWPRVAVAVAGTLRFAPLAAQDWARVREAQALRGQPTGRGLRSLRHAAPLVVPLTVATVRRGHTLQEALDAAAFGSGPRTVAPKSPWTMPDVALATLGSALFALALWDVLGGFR
jgi:energy-coupling factor transporter transmembrane protein EcfT